MQEGNASSITVVGMLTMVQQGRKEKGQRNFMFRIPQELKQSKCFLFLSISQSVVQFLCSTFLRVLSPPLISLFLASAHTLYYSLPLSTSTLLSLRLTRGRAAPVTRKEQELEKESERASQRKREGKTVQKACISYSSLSLLSASSRVTSHVCLDQHKLYFASCTTAFLLLLIYPLLNIYIQFNRNYSSLHARSKFQINPLSLAL